jgi:hypothetical protein
MKTHHIKHYDELTKGSSLESNTNGCQDIISIFQLQEKQRYLGIGDAKELFKTTLALWVVDKGIPFLWLKRRHSVRCLNPSTRKHLR